MILGQRSVCSTQGQEERAPVLEAYRAEAHTGGECR